MVSSNHGVGLYLGAKYTQGNDGVSKKNAYGAALTYNYYFSGFKEKGFVVGGSLRGNISDSPNLMFDEDVIIAVKAAYQW